jgi:TRAP-type uncharacterized transport system fused permease subunit
MVFNPSILLGFGGSVQPILSIISAFLAALFFTIGILGFLFYPIGFGMRLSMIISALLFCGFVITVIPTLFYSGISLCLVSVLWQAWKKKSVLDEIPAKLLTTNH